MAQHVGEILAGHEGRAIGVHPSRAQKRGRTIGHRAGRAGAVFQHGEDVVDIAFDLDLMGRRDAFGDPAQAVAHQGAGLVIRRGRGGDGLLKDHRHGLAPPCQCRPARQPGKGCALQRDAAPDLGRAGLQAEDGERGHRLAAVAFPDQRQNLAPCDLQV